MEFYPFLLQVPNDLTDELIHTLKDSQISPQLFRISTKINHLAFSLYSRHEIKKLCQVLLLFIGKHDIKISISKMKKNVMPEETIDKFVDMIQRLPDGSLVALL